jgi:hypothetical protein
MLKLSAGWNLTAHSLQIKSAIISELSSKTHEFFTTPIAGFSGICSL